VLQRHASFRPREKAVVAVLERLGHTVEFPQAQTCCGQMHYNNRLPERCPAHDAALSRSVSRRREDLRALSVLCGDDPGAFPEDGGASPTPPWAATWTRCCAGVRVLRLLWISSAPSIPARPFRHTVTLHTTCHSLRGTKIGERPVQLLRAVRGLSYVELPQADQCCGFGGTFAIKNADVSAAMLSDKVAPSWTRRRKSAPRWTIPA